MTTLLHSALLGAQRPRLHSCPPFKTTAGVEAVKLAANFGLVLDPWEAWVLEQALGERDDTKWSAFEVALLCPRQNGKGSILEARELAGMFLFGEKRITHSAHEAKTSKEHFERLETLLRDNGFDDTKVHYLRSNQEVSIRLRSNNAKIQFFTRTKDGGRGLGGDLVVLDEAFALTDDQMAALMPTMSARTVMGNPQMWFTSSAGFNHSEVLAKVRRQGIEGRPRLAFFDWSAPKDADLSDRQAWAQANPGLGIRISEEYIESERERFGDEQFARERLGIWADPGNQQVISEEEWSAVRDVTSRPNLADVVFAVEVEADRGSASICAASLNGERVHLELVDWRPGVSWVASRAAELAKKYAAELVLDAGGPAGALIPDLQRLGVQPRTFSTGDVVKASAGLVDAVRAANVVHAGVEPKLDRAVMAGGKRPVGDAWAWKRKDSVTEISPLVGVSLALYGWATREIEAPFVSVYESRPLLVL